MRYRHKPGGGFRRACIAVLAASLWLPAASAAAAPDWSAAPISEGAALAPTGLTFASDGSGILTWEGIGDGRKRTGLAVRAPAGAWTRTADVPGVTWGLARVHVVGSRMVMVGMRAYAFGAYHRARWEVVTATGRLDGTFGRVRVLARDVRWVGSAAGHGEVFAAWTMRRDDTLRGARVAPKRGRVETVSPRGIANPELTVGPRGDVLFAWLRERRIEVRLRGPGGAWTPIRRVAGAGPVPSAFSAALGRDGRALLAWGAVVGDEAHPARWYVRSATASARRTWTRWTTHRLDHFTGTGPASPPQALARFAGNRGLVAWASGSAVKLARPDGGDLQSVPAVAGTSVDDLAVSRTGDVALVFSAPTPAQGPGPGPFVVRAAPGSTLGAAVDVGAPGTTPLAGAKIAFDPATSRPTVAWTALENGVSRVWVAGATALR